MIKMNGQPGEFEILASHADIVEALSEVIVFPSPDGHCLVKPVHAEQVLLPVSLITTPNRLLIRVRPLIDQPTQESIADRVTTAFDVLAEEAEIENAMLEHTCTGFGSRDEARALNKVAVPRGAAVIFNEVSI